MRQPLAGVPLGDVRSLRQFGGRHRAVLLERRVQAQPVADAHHGHAERAAEIAQHFPDELIEFGFVHHSRLLQNGFRLAAPSHRKL